MSGDYSFIRGAGGEALNAAALKTLTGTDPRPSLGCMISNDGTRFMLFQNVKMIEFDESSLREVVVSLQHALANGEKIRSGKMKIIDGKAVEQ